MTLKQCPYCGAEPFYQRYITSVKGTLATTDFSVICLNCEVETPLYKTKEEAAEKWNRGEFDGL